MLPITITLTDGQYRKLMLLYTLGNLIRDTVKPQTGRQALADMELENEIARQAFEQGSDSVEKHGDIYGITVDMEEEMIGLFERFKQYINSGADAAEDERIRGILENPPEDGPKAKTAGLSTSAVPGSEEWDSYLDDLQKMGIDVKAARERAKKRKKGR